jgi:hypothetical protein
MPALLPDYRRPMLIDTNIIPNVGLLRYAVNAYFQDLFEANEVGNVQECQCAKPLDGMK